MIFDLKKKKQKKNVTFLNRAFFVYKQFILSVYIPLLRGGALNWLSVSGNLDDLQILLLQAETVDPLI